MGIGCEPDRLDGDEDALLRLEEPEASLRHRRQELNAELARLTAPPESGANERLEAIPSSASFAAPAPPDPEFLRSASTCDGPLHCAEMSMRFVPWPT